jgi:hypothetical protein
VPSISTWPRKLGEVGSTASRARYSVGRNVRGRRRVGASDIGAPEPELPVSNARSAIGRIELVMMRRSIAAQEVSDALARSLLLFQRDAFFYFVGNNGEATAKAELVTVLELFQRSPGIAPPGR